MEVIEIKRKFEYKGKELIDLDPTLSPRRIMKLYIADFPELANGSVSGPTYKDDVQIYKFETNFGGKG